MSKAKSGGGKGKIIAGLVLLVIIVLLIGGWYVFLRSTPEKTVKTYMAATQRGDNATAKAMLSNRSKESGLAEGMLPPPSTDQDREQPSYTVGKASYEGKTAAVPVTLPVPKGMEQFTGGMKELTITLGLIKEGRQWKIDMQETLNAMIKNPPGMPEMPEMPEAAPGGAAPR
jgi:hypothetical protein